MISTLEVGQLAPEFRLKGPGGQWVTLSEYRGKKNVVLVFFPLAFSPVCSHQLPDLQQYHAEFERVGAEVLGISVDSHYANQAFARQLGLDFPLLSDFHREVSSAYGVLQPEKGYSGRVAFIVDRQGRIAYRDAVGMAGDMNQIPSPVQMLDALRRLP